MSRNYFAGHSTTSMLASRRLFASASSRHALTRRLQTHYLSRGVATSGETASPLETKIPLFSTRVAHVDPKDGSLRLSRRTWRKDGPVCGVLDAALIWICWSRWVVKLAAKHVSCP
jgi:hypothetical protein